MNWFVQRLYSVIFFRLPIGEVLTELYGLWLHMRFAFNDRNPGGDKQKIKYYLLKHCHIVEKGLALPNPRVGFGEPKIKDLISKVKLYEERYGVENISNIVRDTIKEYLEYHNSKNIELNKQFVEILEGFVLNHPYNAMGGLEEVDKNIWSEYSIEKYECFVKSRHSVRDFSEDPVDDEKLFRVFEASLNTPSVCNRQGYKIHYFHDKEQIKELLCYQNGNAGFSDSIDKLLIITGTIKAFTRYEIDQLFIDGGLFSMNLMLAIHAAGMGSCPLNTCMPFFKENKLKKIAGIPKFERLVMMIAVGNLKESFKVAKSEKFTLDQILEVH